MSIGWVYSFATDRPLLGVLFLAADCLHTFIVSIMLLTGSFKDGTGAICLLPRTGIEVTVYQLIVKGPTMENSEKGFVPTILLCFFSRRVRRSPILRREGRDGYPDAVLPSADLASGLSSISSLSFAGISPTAKADRFKSS